LTYVLCVFVQYAAVCHYRRFVCLSGAPVRVRSGHRFYEQIPPGQELQTHIQTDGNDIRPHTVQTRKERTSTEFNLVTAYYEQISPGQELQTHIQTDSNDIRPHTVQIGNERTSTKFNLLTA